MGTKASSSVVAKLSPVVGRRKALEEVHEEISHREEVDDAQAGIQRDTHVAVIAYSQD